MMHCHLLLPKHLSEGLPVKQADIIVQMADFKSEVSDLKSGRIYHPTLLIAEKLYSNYAALSVHK